MSVDLHASSMQLGTDFKPVGGPDLKMMVITFIESLVVMQLRVSA